MMTDEQDTSYEAMLNDLANDPELRQQIAASLDEFKHGVPAILAATVRAEAQRDALREALGIIALACGDTMKGIDTTIPEGAEGRDKAFRVCEDLWSMVKFCRIMADTALASATPATGGEG